MTTAQAIQVDGLTKSYGDQSVLRGVDLTVPKGTIFALLGSNGAGKTTIVRILSTLLKADAGTASVNGFDVASQPANVRESISLTGQFAAVGEILTGRENLVLVARLRHLKDSGGIADGLLARFSLTDAAARRVSTYSGGMRRRLDIAMSLIGDPPVIFLDEPTTGLDPQARVEVWRAVKELAGQGATVLLTTQYLGEAEHLADRIAILHEGRIIVAGNSWILIAAQVPKQVPALMAMKQQQIEDPRLRELYRNMSEMVDCEPDDPRLPQLADRVVAFIEAVVAAANWSEPEDPPLSDDLAQLLDSAFLDSFPSARRLLELLEERGWKGWTMIERADRAE